MALLSPLAGEIMLLRYIVNLSRDSSSHNVLHLYQNDVTPNSSSTSSSFTEPSIGTGYHAITLTGSLWTISQVGSVATAAFSEQTFNFTTGVEVYGYFVTDTSGSILWAERFLSSGGFEIPTGGGMIAVTPRLSVTSA